jgi:hypothetical protein
VKNYFHAELLNPLGSAIFIFAISLFCTLTVPDIIVKILSAAFALFIFWGIINILFQLFKQRKNPVFDPGYKNYQTIKVEIVGDEILFLNGYYFKPSAIYKSKKINATDINEICPDTFPCSAVINNNEVIFFSVGFREKLIEFAEKHNIPTTSRLDIWWNITYPFLDTQFEPEDKNRYKKELNDNGFTDKEIKRIRYKIGRVLWFNMLAWEWQYLGQHAYLSWHSFSSKRYWWTMEIALRNYQL